MAKIRLIIILNLLTIMMAMNMGCAHDGGSDKRIRVVSTIFAPYDFTREIAGDRAELTMLLPPAAESHSYEPTPRDMIRIQECDVFIYVGGESDEWVRTILAAMDLSGKEIVTLIDCVEPVVEEVVTGMEAHEDDETAYDEHVWTSPRNAALIVEKISEALCEADEPNADFYRRNTLAYLQKLTELDETFRSVTDTVLRKTIVFGDRFPFRYLADAYGLEYYAAFPGCASESEPSAQTVAFLIEKIRDENIPVVFYTETSNGKMAATLCEETGAKPMRLHACHSITKDDFLNGVTYLTLMTQNAAALKEALRP